MINARKLTDQGLVIFKTWLANPDGKNPPASLYDGLTETETFETVQIDPDRKFDSRYEFGVYLAACFCQENADDILSAENDGLWAWLTVIYFAQLAEKGVRRSEHYMVTRQGVTGSLAYRHAARTPYELFFIHGEGARICLSAPMHTFGDMAEQLTSRQTISRHRGFFQAAFRLYVQDGKLKRGASTKAKPPKLRTPKDQGGRGGMRRLAVALQRLNLTFDTEPMLADNMIELLPREFAKWKGSST